MAKETTLVWFYNDLRLLDNEALLSATDSGDVVPVFIWAPEEDGDWTPGAAQRWWLHHSLVDLERSLALLGANLIIRKGDSLGSLLEIAKLVSATSVAWNVRYEPELRKRDKIIAESLTDAGLRVRRFNSNMLHHPDKITTNDGRPYQVFTPFYKKFLSDNPVRPPLPKPKQIDAPSRDIPSESISSLNLLPSIDWDQGFYETWNVGEGDAFQLLKSFSSGPANDYDEQRNFPGISGTSRLSPYLRWGNISPATIWNHVESADVNAKGYLRQIVWREFSVHLLWHFPETTDDPLKKNFESMPWRKDQHSLELWQKGLTGYPIVDAAMRQLWRTGWMHNRVRMIVASFLTKHLLQPWQSGAKWFWDTLVDGDLANNTMGWQWTAGSGADAQPYFRIFNPILQSKRFDKSGEYIRTWVPELAAVPDSLIHTPWEMTSEEQSSAGVAIGESYPEPIVDHAPARDRALEAYEHVRNAG